MFERDNQAIRRKIMIQSYITLSESSHDKAVSLTNRSTDILQEYGGERMVQILLGNPVCIKKA